MRGIVHFSTTFARDPGVSPAQWKTYYHEGKQIKVKLEENTYLEIFLDS